MSDVVKGGRPSKKDFTRVREAKAEGAERPASKENEIRVVASRGQRMYIKYAIEVFSGTEGKTKCDSVVLSGMGNAVYNVVNVVEILKRRIKGLHQTTEIGSQTMVDKYEAVEEGKDGMELERKVSIIEVVLSTTPLDTNHPGYQAPLPESEVSEQEALDEPRERRPRKEASRGGRGGGGRGGRGGNEKREGEERKEGGRGGTRREGGDREANRGSRGGRGNHRHVEGDDRRADRRGDDRRGPRRDDRDDRAPARGGRGGGRGGDRDDRRGGGDDRRAPRRDDRDDRRGDRRDDRRGGGDDHRDDRAPRGGRGGGGYSEGRREGGRGGRGGGDRN